MAKNTFKQDIFEGEKVVIFTTNGKYTYDVMVDERIWFEYLHMHSWTVNKKADGRLEIKTSIKSVSKALYRIIAEKEFGEILTYNRQIDHINRNALDNRIKNLRPVCQRFNANNISSKRDLIFFRRHRYKNKLYEKGVYVVQTNINGEIYIKSFTTMNAAEEYRDNVIKPLKEKELEKIVKKDRDIEFERGLLMKLQHGELDEIKSVLLKYGLTIDKKIKDIQIPFGI